MPSAKPFKVCKNCGSPILTKQQETISLCLFFATPKDREEFKQEIMQALPNLKAFDY